MEFLDDMYALHLVTWNGMRYLKTLLISLQQQTIAPSVVRILDNGSTDGTREYLQENIRQLFPQVEIQYEEVNHGFAGGHNILFAKLQEEQRGEKFVWLVNQDLYVAKTYAEEVMKTMNEHTDCAAASGVLLQWKNPGELPNTTSVSVDSLGIVSNKWGKFFERGVGETAVPLHDEEVFGVSGTSPFYRVEHLQQALHPSGSLFDPTFQSYKEDVELSLRLYEGGFSTWVVSKTHAFHDRSIASHTTRSSRSLKSRTNSYRNHLSILTLHELWGVRVLMHEKVKFFYLLMKEPRVLEGFIDFLRLLPTIVSTRREYHNRAKRHYSL